MCGSLHSLTCEAALSLVFKSMRNTRVFRYATGNDGCLFWAESYGDDVSYLLAFREVVALAVR
jgi:hypothetical protein